MIFRLWERPAIETRGSLVSLTVQEVCLFGRVRKESGWRISSSQGPLVYLWPAEIWGLPLRST